MAAGLPPWAGGAIMSARTEGLTVPQQRALARFRRGPVKWSPVDLAWRAADEHLVLRRVMQTLRDKRAVRYHDGAERYGSRSRAVAAPTKKGEQWLQLVPRFCRDCGCSEFHPCTEGCCWVDADLCSACAS